MGGYFNKERIFRFLRRPLEIVVLRYIFGVMLLGPTSMFIYWSVTPKVPLDILVINKSVPDLERREHSAFFWMLKHERIVKGDTDFYDKTEDYHGFHPRLGRDFVIRDFQELDSTGLDSVITDLDLIYLADAYGVYSHDFGGDLSGRNALLYGGVTDTDINFLGRAIEKQVPIIAEFSIFGSPTSNRSRQDLEQLFGLKSSGWLGRYFVSLDSTDNDALPPWVVDLYLKKYGEWPFWDSGIVLVRGLDIVILEYGTHLTKESPQIETQQVYAREYGLPTNVPYPFWFDIVGSPDRDNRVVSIFHLPVNSAGQSILSAHRIPAMFPAVLRHTADNENFYYFAGDFSDNPVKDLTSKFRGISLFQSFLYNKDQEDDRRQFFWLYYRPLMETILADLKQNS